MPPHDLIPPYIEEGLADMVAVVCFFSGWATYACAKRKEFNPAPFWGFLGIFFWPVLLILEISDTYSPDKVAPRRIEYIGGAMILLYLGVIFSGVFA
ncbi:hypothetical protein [Oecophyllibacter saccharovorans]|uniref:hypothetical protein n=1 Tax=Oecophyllibacter saccharovorans TaxID=2558360 RepID=UPI001170B2CF|nr:hypothetical protein [Oecophyllibacter saccharovorans]TPW36583.1 hypothetical protein E3203_02135 [Oecophyllibacter saccharovorans]